MLKLTEIKKNDGKISCKMFLEDCKIPVNLELDEKTAEFSEYQFPEGYEWCISHVGHAKKFLLSIINKKDFPAERVIMWY